MKKRSTAIILLILISIPGLLMGSINLARASSSNANVLSRGAHIHGPDGIYCDANDNIYICSVFGQEILAIDQSGNILESYGPDEGVISADDLFITPDGTIYFTSLLTGYVGRIQPDGTLTTQIVGGGVNSITMSDDGRLFVSRAFMGDGLYELDPDLVEEPILLHGPLGMLNGFDIGPDGYLYAPVFTKGEIVKIDVNTNPATVELLADGLVAPSGVKFDSQGNLYGVDSHTGDLFTIDTETGGIEVVTNVMMGITNLAFDSQDRLFVCQYQDGDVFQILPDGEIRTILDGGLIYPGGVAAMLRGNKEHVIVGDFWTIKDFEAGTGEMSKAHRNMEIGADLTTAITVSADGSDLIVSTWVANMVYVLDSETGHVHDIYFMASWLPMDAIRFMGDIVFTDLGTGTVKKVDNTTIASGLYVPTGLAAIGEDLYVADWASGMVWQIYDDGNPTMVPVATDLAQPEGLTDDIDGSLLVVETGAGRLSRIDTQTGEVSLVADDLALGYPAIPGFPPTFVFSGVDVGPSGNIYVTGDIDNVLYCIGATERVINTVDELPDGAFRDPGNADMYRRKMGKVLGTVQRLIDKGRYGSARAFLKFLRRRTDGTGRDWVVHAGYQQALMDLIDAQISSLPAG